MVDGFEVNFFLLWSVTRWLVLFVIHNNTVHIVSVSVKVLSYCKVKIVSHLIHKTSLKCRT